MLSLLTIEPDMEPASIHSFIIRLWPEETIPETGQTKWRGHITHVPSKQRHYFEDLDAIKQFIAPYLSMIDIDNQSE